MSTDKNTEAKTPESNTPDDMNIGEVKNLKMPSGKQAKAIKVALDSKAEDILQDLDIKKFPNAMIAVAGGAINLDTSPTLTSRLQQLCSRGIAESAAQIGADIIDGGTNTGIMKMIGQGIADRGYRSRLIGIAPDKMVRFPEKQDKEDEESSELVELDKNHSHFVLVDAAKWGDESNIMCSLATAMSNNTPVITLLINGGNLACNEVLESVRRGWPIIVVSGSGRLADILTELKQNPPDFIEDARIAEIVASGNLHLFSIEGNMDKKIAELQRLIRRQLRGDSSLRQAWERFAIYDANANRQQKIFHRIQMAILVLGVLGTALAVVQASLARQLALIESYRLELYYSDSLADFNEKPLAIKKLTEQQDHYKQMLSAKKSDISSSLAPEKDEKIIDVEKHTDTDGDIDIKFGPKKITGLWQKIVNYIKNEFIHWQYFWEFLTELLRNIIILVPIIATALLALANRFNSGTKWLLLRASAEAVKQEIFRYRAYAEIYNPLQTLKKTREMKLAEKLKNISMQLMQTEVNLSALRAHKGGLPPEWSTAPDDDGFKRLTPEEYLSYRIEDQYQYYVSKTNKLEKRLHNTQWLIYTFGGIGTLLAAMGLELWIALTGALVAALGAYLEYHQIENALLKYNKAASELANVRTWWTALPAHEQEKQDNIDILVGQTERTLYSEFSGWMQEMQDTLTTLKEEQEAKLEELKDQDPTKYQDSLLNKEDKSDKKGNKDNAAETKENTNTPAIEGLK